VENRRRIFFPFEGKKGPNRRFILPFGLSVDTGRERGENIEIKKGGGGK